MSRAARISGLIRTRHYDEALSLLPADDGGSDIALLRLRRQCLARMGRFAEAAEAGRAVLAREPEPEDGFRQAQILILCGFWEEAATVALAGWRRHPEDYRFVVPAAQAALADPALLALFDAERPTSAPAEDAVSGRLFLPQRLPFYAAFDADHPGSMEMVRRTRNIVPVMPQTLRDGWQDMVSACIWEALPLVAAVADLPPAVGRAAAACYVGARLPVLLADAGGAGLDFLTNVPFTLGQRPFVLWYDIVPTLFQPFQPFDSTDISPADPWFWIIRAFLESDRCLSILTHYATGTNPLARLFASPRIARKLVQVVPYETDGAIPTGEVRRPAAKPRRLLFTTSYAFQDEGFYYRGGVDVLAAFLTLAEEFPDIELILRTPLPVTLGAHLRKAVERHPRIRWLPGYLPAEEFHALVEGAHLLLLPSGVNYRNVVVHALKCGVVPVVADVLNMDELVTDGETGVIVSGRSSLYRVDETGRVVQNLLPLLQATDAPADPAFHTRFVDAVRRLLADGGEIDRLSRSARAAAARRWEASANLHVFERILEEAMERAGRLHRQGGLVHLPLQALRTI